MRTRLSATEYLKLSRWHIRPKVQELKMLNFECSGSRKIKRKIEEYLEWIESRMSNGAILNWTTLNPDFKGLAAAILISERLICNAR